MLESNRHMQSTLNKIIPLLIVSAALLGCGTTYQSSDLFQNIESEQFFKTAQNFQIKGNFDSALFYYDKADKSAPNTAVILHERGLLKSNRKMYDDALIDLNQSIELTSDPQQKEIRISNRALTYFEMGNQSEACNDWKNAGKWGKSYVKEYCQP